MQTTSKKSKLLKIIIILCLVGVAAFFVLRNIKDEQVFENAQLELSGTILLSAYGGKIDSIQARQFDKVMQNASLMKIEDTLFREALLKAEENYAATLLGLQVNELPVTADYAVAIDKKKNEIAELRIAEENAKLEHAHWANTLSAAQFAMRNPEISKEDYQVKSNEVANAQLMKDSTKKRLEDSSIKRADAEKQLTNFIKSQTVTDLLYSQPEFWQETIRDAKVALASTEIKSPIDGIVAELYVQVGDTTIQGQPLIKIALSSVESYPITVVTSLENANNLEVGLEGKYKSSNANFDVILKDIYRNDENANLIFYPVAIPSDIVRDFGNITITN